MTGSLGRARAALSSRDFRLLLAARLLSQLGDGAFQAYLIDRLVFLSPENQSTTAGVARAFAVLVIPFSLVGPLAGVVIDRWSRKRILAFTPLVRAAAIAVLLPIEGRPPGWILYAVALAVLSLDRFYLATAGAVMPVLVPDEDLLVGNSLASAQGTVATFVGLVAGTQLVGVIGPRGLLAAAVAGWPASALAAAAIRNPLRALKPEARLAADLRRLAVELWSGARRLRATPVAVGSIASVSLDQFLIGVITVLGVVVFKEQFNQGVASYGRILGAGGLGVLVGTLTVGWFEGRLAKPRIVAMAFAVAGIACLAVAPAIVGPTILLLSFCLGLTFPWRKVPADTMVQESIPDRYRGRVFALYDMAFALPRVLAALAAVILIPRLSTAWIVAACGAVYLAWIPVMPWSAARPVWARLRFYAGSRADESPRALVVGGEEEPVEMIGSWQEERDGVRLRHLRLRAADRILDVVGEADGRWRIERALPVGSGPG